jgi:hypothetical protein
MRFGKFEIDFLALIVICATVAMIVSVIWGK